MKRRIEVDDQTGAVYVYLRDAKVARTVEMPVAGMGLMLHVDIDAEGCVVGVEII